MDYISSLGVLSPVTSPLAVDAANEQICVETQIECKPIFFVLLVRLCWHVSWVLQLQGCLRHLASQAEISEIDGDGCDQYLGSDQYLLWN